jgi:hypothetical protein
VEFPVAQLNSKRPRPSTSKSIFWILTMLPSPLWDAVN